MARDGGVMAVDEPAQRASWRQAHRPPREPIVTQL